MKSVKLNNGINTFNHKIEIQLNMKKIMLTFEAPKRNNMKKLEIIICVDEKHLENKLINQLEQFDTIEILDIIKGKVELIEKMSVNHPDILIMDLDSNEWNYNDIINQVQRPPFIIGITTKIYNAISLLDNGIFDIITPKIKEETFYKKMAKILRIIRYFKYDNNSVAEGISTYHKKNNKSIETNKDYIFVKHKKSNIRLYFEDILYVCNVGNYLKIELNKGKICYHTSTLKKFQNILPKGTFFRINKSVVVNAQKIDRIIKDEIQIKQHTFKVSRIYSRSLKESVLNSQ